MDYSPEKTLSKKNVVALVQLHNLKYATTELILECYYGQTQKEHI